MTKNEVIRQLLEDICHTLHKHEVQTWKDCDGTDAERMATALILAREALAVVTDRLVPKATGPGANTHSDMSGY